MRKFAIQKAADDIVKTNKIFKLSTAVIRNVEYTVFKNVPLTLPDMLKQSSTAHDDGNADYLVYQNERWTYDEFCTNVKRAAWFMQRDLNVAKGVRVAIAMRNYPDLLILKMAIASLGATVVFINAWWTTQEVDYALSDSGAKIIFADGPRAQRLEPLQSSHGVIIIGVREAASDFASGFTAAMAGPVAQDWPSADIDADDDFAIMYSSGTTGHPKGVVQTHRGAISAVYTWLMQTPLAERLAAASDIPAPQPLRPATLVVTPLFHVTATRPMFLLSLPAGAKVCLMYKWDAENAVRLIADEQITRFLGVPTQSANLMDAAHRMGEPLDTLDYLGSGGAKRPASQVAELHKAFPKANLATGWGMTETNACGIGLIGDEYLENPGAAGRLYPPIQELVLWDDAGQEVPVGEIGELTVKSACNMRCYLNKPEATEEVFQNGWLRTGDLGKIDENGVVTILDRKKNIVIRGGENIACLDVEGALRRHPAIAESCAFSVPDERLGEVVGAGVRLRDGMQTTKEEIKTFLAQKIAHFKIPDHIWIYSEPLPRGATDKLDRRALRAICLETLKA
jgi:long-chain acyl-CoA synthetase